MSTEILHMERVKVKFMLLLRLNRRGHFDVEYKSIHNLKRAKIQQKSLFYLMFYCILYSASDKITDPLSVLLKSVR